MSRRYSAWSGLIVTRSRRPRQRIPNEIRANEEGSRGAKASRPANPVTIAVQLPASAARRIPSAVLPARSSRSMQRRLAQRVVGEVQVPGVRIAA
jgi:hypothetical protein